MPSTERLWVYDLPQTQSSERGVSAARKDSHGRRTGRRIGAWRTNELFTLKQKPLRQADLEDLVAAYRPGGQRS
ncbi:hypothetical protein [Lapillicoccus sp.]|uniref:hypothetical protein n=1 Tax=Lapillicoccus sp. TaxID=1909287 RepID=UPI0025DE2B01|nr:hypothetical protein [Lapillicoccus sp.]